MPQNQLSPITKDEWVHWKNSPVTRFFLAALHTKRIDLLEGWARGQCEDQRNEHITMGRAQSIQDTIEYVLREFDYIEEEKKDGN